MTTAFSASFKQQAVEKAIRRGRGVTLRSLADEWGVSCGAIQRWIRESRARTPISPDAQRGDRWRYDNRKTTAGLDS